MARVELTTQAREDLIDLDGSQRTLVLKALKKLETSPEQRGEPLGNRATGDLTGFRKLVVGNKQIRIIYRVEGDGTICVVWVIGQRVDGECYDLAVARLQLYMDTAQARQVQAVLDEVWQPLPR